MMVKVSLRRRGGDHGASSSGGRKKRKKDFKGEEASFHTNTRWKGKVTTVLVIFVKEGGRGKPSPARQGERGRGEGLSNRKK